MKNSRWLDYTLTIIVLTILWYGASLLLGSQPSCVAQSEYDADGDGSQ
jgi:hypothetical protein